MTGIRGMIVNTACIFAILLFCAGSPASGESPLPPQKAGTPSPYAQAILEAESSTGQNTDDESGAYSGSWGLSEALSVVALLVALVLVFGIVRSTRGGFLKPSGRDIRIQERLALGRHSSLMIVRVRGRDYWLTESGNTITLLAELPSGDDGSPSPDTGSEPTPLPEASPSRAQNTDSR